MSSSEFGVLGAYSCNIYTYSATLRLMMVALTIWYFHVLFMRKRTPGKPLFASELHSTWPLCMVVNHSSRLLDSPIPITSHTNLVSLISSSLRVIERFHNLLYAGVALPQVLQYLREVDAPAMQSCRPLPCGIGA